MSAKNQTEFQTENFDAFQLVGQEMPDVERVARERAEKAERTGRKVGGYTSDELRRHEAEAMALACALDHSI